MNSTTILDVVTPKISQIVPSSDVIVKDNQIEVSWVTEGRDKVSLRKTQPYSINVYGMASCAGPVLKTETAETEKFMFSSIKDNESYSFGVTVYDVNSNQSAELCSNLVTGNSIMGWFKSASTGFLSLAADFNSKIAYAGSVNGNILFEAVDFADESNPQIFRTINASSTPASTGNTSRGIAVYDNGKRVVAASNGTSSLEVFDVTNNPRTGVWTKTGTATGLSNIRKIAKVKTVSGTQTRVYGALRQGIGVVNINEPAGTAVTANASSTAFTAGNCFGNGTIIDDTWMFSSCYTSNDNILVNLNTFAADETVQVVDPGTGTLSWTTSSTVDSSKIFVGGHTASFFSYVSSRSPRVRLEYNVKVHPTLYRDSVIVVEDGRTLLYATGAKTLDVWDLTDGITPPVHKAQLSLTRIGVGWELYGVQVDPTNHRAYLASNDGFFIIVNTKMLAPPASVYPSY